jgi:hypothetical protein
LAVPSFEQPPRGRRTSMKLANESPNSALLTDALGSLLRRAHRAAKRGR